MELDDVSAEMRQMTSDRRRRAPPPRANHSSDGIQRHVRGLERDISSNNRCQSCCLLFWIFMAMHGPLGRRVRPRACCA